MTTPKTAEEIQYTMRRVRCDLDEQVDELVDNAKQITASFTDWRTYVAANPWLCLGIAAGVGYLVIPARVTVDRPVAETLAELTRTGAIQMEASKPKPTLLTQSIDMGIGIASSLALQGALSLLRPALDGMISHGLRSAGIDPELAAGKPSSSGSHPEGI